MIVLSIGFHSEFVKPEIAAEIGILFGPVEAGTKIFSPVHVHIVVESSNESCRCKRLICVTRESEEISLRLHMLSVLHVDLVPSPSWCKRSPSLSLLLWLYSGRALYTACAEVAFLCQTSCLLNCFYGLWCSFKQSRHYWFLLRKPPMSPRS